MPHSFLYAILIASALLAIGLTLRATMRLLKLFYIPASVVAGLIGFALVQLGLHTQAVRPFSLAITGEFATWPTWLISVVFASLLLDKPGESSLAAALRRGARSGILAWIIILGQIFIGLIVFVVAVKPFHPRVPASFGQLLEVSWAGGHGTAGAMGEVFRSLGFVEGRDLGFFLATVGLIYGVGAGLFFVNLAVRRGWTAKIVSPAPTTETIAPTEETIAATTLDERREVIIPYARPNVEAPLALPSRVMATDVKSLLDPLALQVVILAAAFGVGFLLQQSFIVVTTWTIGVRQPQVVGFLSNIPLFLFTLLGGSIVRRGMAWLRVDGLIDAASLQRLAGVSIEFLIVAAISTMRVEALSAFWWPILLLFIGASVWSVFTLLVLAPRLLPKKYWFELGLLNFGFSTANTPQGMMLLRIVDPDLKSGAAEDYAVAAPLSAPFVGGGVMTVIGFPVLLQQVPALVVAAALLPIMGALYALGRTLAKRDEI